jgi:hypothetical protein
VARSAGVVRSFLLNSLNSANSDNSANCLQIQNPVGGSAARFAVKLRFTAPLFPSPRGSAADLLFMENIA